MNDNEFQEIPSEEDEQALQEIISQWVDENVPKEFVAIINPKNYLAARNAITTIIKVLNANTDEDTRPLYSLKYDSAVGMMLALNIQFREYDVRIDGAEFKKIASMLPDDCVIMVLPQKDYKTTISFTFHDVKNIYY